MKTGFFKKAAAVFMAGAMAVSLAGCADDSWSAKDDTQTLAAGVYIYNLYSAYQEAQSRVMMESLSSGTSSGSTDFYSQQIDGKNVTQWMQEFVSRLIGVFKKRVLVNAGAKPYISVKLQAGDSPLETLRQVFQA